MDWAKWIADLLASGIGGVIGGTVGAYFKGYSEEKGKHLATYEDIQSLLAQERGKAYEQEKGKRLATHEDIENVLKEVHAVTRETETIKAQIGSDLWTRQKVWTETREAYVMLLQAGYEKGIGIASLRAEWQKQGSQGDPSRMPSVKRLMEGSSKLANASAIGRIFLGTSAVGALDRYYTASRDVELEAMLNPKDGAETVKVHLELLNSLKRELIAAAQTDLGIRISHE